MKYQNKIICDVPRKLDIGENHNMCTAMASTVTYGMYQIVYKPIVSKRCNHIGEDDSRDYPFGDRGYR